MSSKSIILLQPVNIPQQGAIDIFYYAKYLTKLGWKVTVIIKEIIGEIDDDINYIALGKMSDFLFLYECIKKLHKETSISKPEYIYFFAQHPFSVLIQLYTKYILGIATIYDVVSGPIGHSFLSYTSFLTIKIGTYLSDAYVVLDAGLISKLGLSRARRHCIIPMGYDETLFNSKGSISGLIPISDSIKFTYIGTLDKNRNLNIFIESFIQVLNRSSDPLELYIVGDGNSKKELINISNKYPDKIRFLGLIPHEQVPGVISMSDILVSYIPQKAYFEHQPPTKLIEYLACGKPVIATRTKAQADILTGVASMFLHNDDTISTTEKIFYLIKELPTLKNEQEYIKNLVSDYKRESLVGKLSIFLDKK